MSGRSKKVHPFSRAGAACIGFAVFAVVCGDATDPASRVSRLARDGRAFRALEAVNAQPAITYLARVRPGDEP